MAYLKQLRFGFFSINTWIIALARKSPSLLYLWNSSSARYCTFVDTLQVICVTCWGSISGILSRYRGFQSYGKSAICRAVRIALNICRCCCLVAHVSLRGSICPFSATKLCKTCKSKNVGSTQWPLTLPRNEKGLLLFSKTTLLSTSGSQKRSDTSAGMGSDHCTQVLWGWIGILAYYISTRGAYLPR